MDRNTGSLCSQNSFIFMQFTVKILQNNRLVLLPLGSHGFSTDFFPDLLIFIDLFLSHNESTIHKVNLIDICVSLFQERYMDGKQDSGLLCLD